MAYKLVWADEFKTDGPPDPENWSFEQGFVRNEEHQLYQPQNAFVKGGKLIIEGRRERVRNPNFKPGSDNWRESREWAEYTAASLKTQGKREWLYGRFELRARIPIASGLWPAFWTLGRAGEWPSSGEIDILEFYRGQLLANVAWGTKQRWVAKWASAKTPVEKLGGVRWASRFHTWRMDWDEEAIALFVDDQLLNRVELARTLNPDGTNPFQQPHYLLLNLAIGGQNGGDPSATAFPSRFEIDWVRVFQRT